MFKFGIRFRQSLDDIFQSGPLRRRESLLELFGSTPRILQCLVERLTMNRFRCSILIVQPFPKRLEFGFSGLRIFYQRLKFCSLLARGLKRHRFMKVLKTVLFFHSGWTAISGETAASDPGAAVALGSRRQRIRE